MPDLYMIGTKHDLQREHPLRHIQDTRLRDKLAEVIGNRSVVLVAEEVDANEQDKQIIYGRNLANSRTPKIPWLSLDLTTVQLRNAGIWDDLEAAAKLTGSSCMAGLQEVYHPVHANAIREVCWLEKIRAVCDALKLDSGTVLVTCGRVHLEPLTDKARKCEWAVAETIEVPEGLMTEIGEIKSLP